MKIIWDMTAKCNLRCKHCYNTEYSMEELSTNNSNFAHKFLLCTLKIQYLAVIQLSMFRLLCSLQSYFQHNRKCIHKCTRQFVDFFV